MTIINKLAALVSLVVIASCSMGIASPSYDLYRSNVQACSPNAGVSASGVTLVAGETFRFVTPEAASKYDFSCRKNVTVLPPEVDPYRLDSVMAYLRSAGYEDVVPSLRDANECGISDSEKDPDAAGVPDRAGTGCYVDDGQPGTYGDEAVNHLRPDERW